MRKTAGAQSCGGARVSRGGCEKQGVVSKLASCGDYDPAYSAAMKRIEAGEIGTPVVFKSVGAGQRWATLSSYHANINGMLFYTNTIHDFDLARWLMQDEVSEVHAYTTVAIRPEVANSAMRWRAW